MKITIGCDPEIFVVNKEGKFRSAHGMVPGTKEKPFKVNLGAVQVDGMALEYNIDPVSNVDDFVTNNVTVMEQLRQMLPAGHDFAIVPSCRFNGNHFRIQPDEAKELGCTPDFNAYTLAENPKPDNKTTMRTASGHIHIGFIDEPDYTSDEHMTRCATLVKQLDFYLGLSSLLYDKDTSRRRMYGKAGAFRPKPYGLEYRVLSNAWLTSEARMRFVYETTIKAINDLREGVRPFQQIGEQRVINDINNSRSVGACYDLSLVSGGKELAKRAASLA